MRRKGNCWWECKLVQPLWKTIWRFLNKLKIDLPGNSLAVQWLGLHASTAGVTGSIPGWGTKIPHATWQSQKKKKKRKKKLPYYPEIPLFTIYPNEMKTKY